MKLDREGRFKGIILAHGVDTTGSNELLTFSAEIRLTDEYANGEWQPLGPGEDEMTIEGRFYLSKKDGTINTTQVESLKATFGWDGRDPMWLQTTDLTGKTVQATVAEEEYNNNIFLKWQWINPADSQGQMGVSRATGDKAKAIAAKFGAMFRASTGGTPAPAPKPNGKPATIPARRAAPESAAAKKVTMQEAWDTWSAKMPDQWTDGEAQELWA
ncbi:MAG: hypothetical protein ABFD89_03725 [Bryobacteraceae bacterium]